MPKAPSSSNTLDKGRVTHFLCVPLVNKSSGAQWEQSLSHFRSAVTAPQQLDDNVTSYSESLHGRKVVSKPARRLPESIVRPPGTMHLTIGVMNLGSQDRLDQASALLARLGGGTIPHARCPEGIPVATVPSSTPLAESTALDTDAASAPDILGGNAASAEAQEGFKYPHARRAALDALDNQLTISVHSLTTMQTPTNSRVLYASPLDPSQTLSRICTLLREEFTNAGIMQPDTRPLLLHATVLNTIYAKNRGANRKTLTIDATALLKQFDDFTWASDVTLDRIAICRMGAEKVEDESGKVVDEVYREVFSIPFPLHLIRESE